MIKKKLLEIYNCVLVSMQVVRPRYTPCRKSLLMKRRMPFYWSMPLMRLTPSIAKLCCTTPNTPVLPWPYIHKTAMLLHRSFVQGGKEIASAEGTTQCDPISMSLYTISITPLLQMTNVVVLADLFNCAFVVR